jgi:hypothetical protein
VAHRVCFVLLTMGSICVTIEKTLHPIPEVYNFVRYYKLIERPTPLNSRFR